MKKNVIENLTILKNSNPEDYIEEPSEQKFTQFMQKATLSYGSTKPFSPIVRLILS